MCGATRAGAGFGAKPAEMLVSQDGVIAGCALLPVIQLRDPTMAIATLSCSNWEVLYTYNSYIDQVSHKRAALVDFRCIYATLKSLSNVLRGGMKMAAGGISRVILPSKEEFQRSAGDFFEQLSQSVPADVDTSAWVAANASRRWVQDFLLQPVRQRLGRSMQRLGHFFCPASDYAATMLRPDVELPEGKGHTSWAYLSYLAVLHSHDAWHQPWHHDFFSANAAWHVLKSTLGNDVARLVCAMIAFQNSLRATLWSHGKPSEVLTYPHCGAPCDDEESSKCKLQADLKAVILDAVGGQVSEPFWRSCAYAALALDAIHGLASPGAGSCNAIEEFAERSPAAPGQVEKRILISIEYGNYHFGEAPGLCDSIIEGIKPQLLDPDTLGFCSISLGRQWCNSDVKRLSKAILDRHSTMPEDAVEREWYGGSSDGHRFFHVSLGSFDSWLETRMRDVKTTGHLSPRSVQVGGATR